MEYADLLSEIEQIPAVDVHSHIQPDSPGASDLADIALYHFVASELETSGISSSVFEIENPRKRVVEASAGFARILNTTSYWCLEQILGDLYGVSVPEENDIDSVISRIEQSYQQPQWTEEVLKRANVAKVLACTDWRKPVPASTEVFLPVVRVDSLINEAHNSRTLDQLGKITGHSVYEAGDLKKAIGELLGKTKTQGAVAVGASFEPQTDFVQGNKEEAGSVLSLALLGQKITRDDRRAMRSYVLDVVLQYCAEYELPFQLMLGIKHVHSSEQAITGYEPGMVAMYADIFARHKQTKFDVFISDLTLEHELAVIARNFSNVTLSGMWWYLEFPSFIRRVLRERIEMLPMTKCCGFFSDARCVEWVYGRAKLFRKELALTLSRLISEKYLSRDTALRVARHYLFDNPRQIYRV
ncbi:MAG: glucuronate isomerase [Armatimonadota bacterium]